MRCIKCKKELPDNAIYCCYCGKKQVVNNKKTKSRCNGTGTAYRRGKTWTAEVTIGYVYDKDTDKTKRLSRRKGGFATKKDTIEYLTVLKNEQSRAKSMTLLELHEKYIRTNEFEKLSKSQQNKLGYGWNRCKSIWSRDIKTITVDDLNDLIEGLTFYPAKDIKTVLSHIYNMAIQRELVAFNKTNYIDMPELNKKERPHFTNEEIEKLWKSYENGNTDLEMALVLIYTGMRPGELRSIKKSDVNISEKYITGGIKTDAGRNRVIAIADKILPLIIEMYNRSKSLLVELNEKDFYEKYNQSIETAGVSHYTPYACRHTYFTRLAEQGIQPAIITEMGGHTSYQVTLGYTHIALDKKLEAVNQI